MNELSQDGSSSPSGDRAIGAASGPDAGSSLRRLLVLALVALGCAALGSLAAAGWLVNSSVIAPLLPKLIFPAVLAAAALIAGSIRLAPRLLASAEAVIAVHDRARADLRTLNEALEQHVAELSDTAERRAQELTEARLEVGRQEQLLSSIASAISEGLIVCDHKMSLQLFNSAAERIFGAEFTAIPPAQWLDGFEMFADDDSAPLSPVEWPLARAMKGELAESRWRLRHRQSARELRLSGRALPLRDENGAIRRALMIFRESVELNRESVELNDESAELSRESAELNDEIIASELPQPEAGLIDALLRELDPELAAIDDLVRLRLEASPADEQEPWLKTIKLKSCRLLELTAQLVDYLRAARGELAFENSAFDLCETVEAAIGSMSDAAAARGLTLSATLDNSPARLMGDAHRLRQVLNIFLSTAIHLAGSGEILVTGALQGDGGTQVVTRWAIRMPGVQPVQSASLQSTPVAIQSAAESEALVSGIGFALAMRMIEAMGGEATITPEGDNGVIVSFQLEFAAEVGRHLSSPSLDPAVFGQLRQPSGNGTAQEGFDELLAAFLRFLPFRLQHLETAINDADSKSLARQTDGLRGASAEIGAARLELLCADVAECALGDKMAEAALAFLGVREEADKVGALLARELAAGVGPQQDSRAQKSSFSPATKFIGGAGKPNASE